jgi:hypothetical protein
MLKNRFMNKKFLAVLLLIFFFGSPLYAQISLKAEVDKKKITTDETLAYKVIVASTQKTIPAVQLPKFEGFRVISQANSSTVSFAQGGAKTIVVYACILVPLQKGKFTINPSTVKTKDSVISSESFEIEVTQGKSRPPEKTQPPSPGEKVTL